MKLKREDGIDRGYGMVRKLSLLLVASSSHGHCRPGMSPQGATFHGRIRPVRCTVASDQPVQQAAESISAFLARECGDGSGTGGGSSSSEWAVTPLPALTHTVSPNECFKATSPAAAAPVFVKRSKGAAAGGPSPHHHRLQYEFEGMRAFAKYSKGLIAEPIAYSDAQQVLVTEWLTGYVPLSSFFGFVGPDAAALDVGLDVYQAMGTAMGRAHARTHRACLDDARRIALATRFRNPEPFAAWDEHLFSPTLRLLEDHGGSGSTCSDDVLRLLRRYNAPDAPGAGPDGATGALSDAVSRLRRTYLEKKEALMHGDLHSNNVMVRPPGGSDRDHRQLFKVIDFEKCACGPAGLDLGMFIASFLWYYPGHSDPSWRRGLAGGVLAVIDAYRQAFKVQLAGAGGAAQSRDVAIDMDAILNEILVDALGFAGLYTLFLGLHRGDAPGGVVEVLPLGSMPELSFGDTSGRLAAVQRRQTAMSVHALLLYLDHTMDGADRGWRACGVSGQSFAAVFATDDKVLQRGMDHATEFWY